jgi:hypothetical protein
MLPLTVKDFLEKVARETARMSWPGQMSPILREGTNRAVEDYFGTHFLPYLVELWNGERMLSTYDEFDIWHRKCASDLGDLLQRTGRIKPTSRTGKPTNYRGVAVACKLLDTFMFQLMKYEKFRPLWGNLHLILDDTACFRLYGLSYSSLRDIKSILQSIPYTLTYDSYLNIQTHLLSLVDELNQRPNIPYKITSRIELNPVLWA